MKFAIPTIDNKLCPHFGHCQTFAIIETEASNIIGEESLQPPVHEPGSFPKFLADHDIDIIIAGGMGIKAQELFAQNNIKVFLGINSNVPKDLVRQYLDNNLVSGDNLCDH